MAINVKDKLVTLESLGVAYSTEQDAREEADQALSTRIDNIVAPEGDPSLTEVSDARVSGSTTYPTLKARLDADKAAIGTDIDGLKADLGDLGDIEVNDFEGGNDIFPYKSGDVRTYGGLTKIKRLKNYYIFDGAQTTGNLLRFAVFNDGSTVVSSTAPTYANRPAWYSPVNAFVLGHRYYFGVRLISGTYEWTGTSALDNFFDVRIQDNSNEVLYQSKNSEWTCTKIPEMICFTLGKGTYNNAVFELVIVDVTFNDKYIPEKHAIMDSSAAKLKLFFITDIHANLGAIVRLSHYASEHAEQIDEIVNGGDTARYEYASTANSNYFNSELAQKALAVIGNHDSAAYDENNKITWWAKTQKEVYDRYLAPYISGWGVVQPANAAELGLNYYYKDYSLIRVIYLDAMFWDATQRAWLVNVLESARVGAKSVICVAHGTDGGFTGDTDCNWTWYEDPDEVGYHSNLRFDGTAASAVADFITAGGEFICWLTGHTHRDKIGHMTAYPNQFALIMNRSGGKPTETRAADYSGTLVVVDRVNKLVKLIRCGDTFDAYMRPKNTLCYNYSTQELISQT